MTTAKCERCGKPIRLKIKGRPRRFCGNRCRSGARRDRDFVSLGYPNGAATQNDQRKARQPGISERENRDRALPVNLVGGGYRWPKRLAPDLVAKIVAREIGGKVIHAGTGRNQAANDNQPVSKKRRAA